MDNGNNAPPASNPAPGTGMKVVNLLDPLQDVAQAITDNIQEIKPDDNLGIDPKSYLMSLFTYFEEIAKSHISSKLYYIVQNLMPMLQVVSVGFYSFVPGLWSSDTIPGSIILVFNRILTFSNVINYEKLELVPLLVPFFWYFLHGLFILTAIMILRRQGTLSRWFVSISAVLVQLCTYVCYLTTFHSFAMTFMFLASQNVLAIVFFILYLVIIGYITIITRFATVLVNYSTHPSISMSATFDGEHPPRMLLCNAISLIVTRISLFFDPWFLYIAIIFHFLANLYLYLDVLRFPAVKFSFNVIFLTLYEMFMTSDLVVLIHYVGVEVPDLYRLIIPLIFFPVFFIANKLICAKVRNYFLSVINPPDVDDESRLQYFKDLEVKSLKRAFQFLHVGFQACYPWVLNGTMGLEIGKKFKDYDLWMAIANLISFIPCNKAQLSECITNLRALYSKKLIDKVKLLHLIKLEQYRAQVSTFELSMKTDLMTNMSFDGINATRQFWYVMATSPDRMSASNIVAISKQISKCRDLWEEIFGMYPNETRLATEYSRFLIECIGKFEEGLTWHLKSGHLKKGYAAKIDALFQAFVISMPRVWHEHMVDRFGNLLVNGAYDTTHQTTITSTATAQDKLEQDLELGLLDQVASQEMEWPRLRISLCRATSHYRPKFLTMSLAFKYISLIIWCALLITTIVFYSTAFSNMFSTYNQQESIINIRVALAHLRTLIFLNFNKIKNTLYTDADWESVLPASALHESGAAFQYNDFVDGFKKQSVNALDAYIELYQSYANIGLNGDNITKSAQSILQKTVKRLRNSASTSTKVTQNISSKEAITSLFWNYQTLSDFSAAIYNTLLASDSVLESTTTHLTFFHAIDNVLTDFSKQANDNGKDADSFIGMLIMVLLIVSIIVCFPLQYIPLWIIKHEADNIFEAMKKVSPEGAKAASNPITKMYDNGNECAMQTTYGSNVGVIMSVIIYTALFIAIFVLSGVSFSILKSQRSSVSELIDLSRFGSIRHPLTAEILDLVVMLVTLSENPGATNVITAAEIQPYFTNLTKELNDAHTNFLQGYDGKRGIYSISQTIRDFHIVDQCNDDISTGETHQFYSCVSLERALSTYILYAEQIESDTVAHPFSDPLTINFIHFATNEMNRLQIESRNMMTTLIRTQLTNSTIIAVVLLVIAIVILIVEMGIGIYLERTYRQALKTTLILIRHLPPPVVAETPEIVNFLLIKKSNETHEITDPKQVVFDQSESPILCVGEGFIIETINESFKKAFKFTAEQLIGRKLTCLIEEPTNQITDMTVEEQGAFHMYEKMKLMAESADETKCTYPIKCLCGDDESVNSTVTVYGVRDKTNTLNNYVVIIEDKRETAAADAQLEAARRESDLLASQLIPREIGSYLNEKEEGYTFATEKATMIAVCIGDALEISNESPSKLDEIYNSIELLAHKNPPYIKACTLYDTLLFVGGLFSEDDAPIDVTMAFINEIKELLTEALEQRKSKKRFSIAVINGGPLVGGVHGDEIKSFEIVGQLIDDTIDFISYAPPDGIILSEEVKEKLNEERSALCTNGPKVWDKKTYFIV